MRTGRAVPLAFLVLLIWVLYTSAHAQQIREASDWEKATAELAIAVDGSVVTARRHALDSMKFCAEPRDFGKLKCITVGDLRSRP